MPVRNLRHYDEEFDYIELTKQTKKPLFRTTLLKLNLRLN